jgi:dTDP-4-amino-4,6-dideoxygalactose transaminase
MTSNLPANRDRVRNTPWDFGLISTSQFGDLEREYVLRVLDNRRVFRFMRDPSESETRQLEVVYERRLGVTHALALNSGTSALICAMIGAGIGPGDEVIVPAYTYIATASAVVAARAVPVIVDVDDSLTIDPAAIEAAITPRTVAIVPVHMRGVPAQMDKIMEIAHRHGLLVIEDVAQANGGSFNSKPLGSFGAAGCFSFQQYKIVTAGEGGLLATNDEALYGRAFVHHDAAASYWGTGQPGAAASFPGETLRLSEINSALGLAQTTRLDSIIERLQHIKSSIVDGVSASGLTFQRIPDPAGDISTSLVWFCEDADAAREFSSGMTAHGIPTGTIGGSGFPDRHVFRHWDFVMSKRGFSELDNPWLSEHYTGDVQYSPEMCAPTVDLLSRAVVLELHPDMTPEDCRDAIAAINDVAAKASK